MPRLKYTVAQQIASMKSHGVSFALCDEDTAAEFLTSRTYFFKLKAFENNFERVGDRYTGLDFAYLKDLSTIDFHLRTLLSYCCLNIEHALKVRFNRLIMDDPAEDGYDVVHRFDPDGEFRFHGDYRHSRYHHSVYTEGLLRKYFDDPAVWNLWETVDFSTLCRLYQSYIDSRGMKDNSTNLFRSVRILRNAASHGNCLIIGIRKDIRPTRYVKNCLSELDRLTGSNTTPLYSSLRRYPLVHDFASVYPEGQGPSSLDAGHRGEQEFVLPDELLIVGEQGIDQTIVVRGDHAGHMVSGLAQHIELVHRRMRRERAQMLVHIDLERRKPLPEPVPACAFAHPRMRGRPRTYTNLMLVV